MTESEIMKALECHSNDDVTCAKCPLEKVIGCTVELNNSALALINRKNAENEKLNFENLQMIASIKNLKSEAIKEFIERLKAYPVRFHIEHDHLDKFVPFIDDNDLDQIAKEMGCGE